jgi:hypothetical protein
MSLKFNFGFLQGDLDQFIIAVREIASCEINDETKGLVAKMIEETRKIYEKTVLTLIPFYKIIKTDEARYLDEYSSQFLIFKEAYLMNTGELSTHCKIIRNSLDELLKKRNWLGKFPYLNDSLKKLEDLSTSWTNTRYTLEVNLNTFLDEVNSKLTEINELNNKNAIKESRTLLSEFLTGLDKSIQKIKTQVDDLKVISAKLV